MIIHPNSSITAGEIISRADDLEALVDMRFTLPVGFVSEFEKRR
jgi:hypothetical protein